MNQRLSLSIQSSGGLPEVARLNMSVLCFSESSDGFQIADIKDLLVPNNVLEIEWTKENCHGTWPPLAPTAVELWIDN